MKVNCFSDSSSFGKFSHEDVLIKLERSIESNKFLSNEGNFSLFKLRLTLAGSRCELLVKHYFKNISIQQLQDLSYNDAFKILF